MRGRSRQTSHADRPSFHPAAPPPLLSCSSSPAAYEEAKQLSNQVLDLALQDSLTTFFLVNCLMSTSAVTWLITKVRSCDVGVAGWGRDLPCPAGVGRGWVGKEGGLCACGKVLS